MRTRILAMPIVALIAAIGQAQDPQGPGPQIPIPQQAQNGADQGDSPENGVARISFLQGNVSVHQGNTGDQAAVMNGPLMKDGALLTGENSQAEIQFDGLNLLRVAPGSEVRVGDLQYHRYPIQIAVGTATYRMLRDSDAEIELSLPAVAVRPVNAGTYRISVQPDGSAQVTVLAGQAEVYSAKGSQFVQAGQMMMVRGTENDPEFQVVNAPAQDDFDRFNVRRDADLNRAVSPRYVSPDVYGTEELDANGVWTEDPNYGNVWVPRVPTGWAPYRVGRWVWEPYYGWTWVSADPWGWAPYHYGAWFEGPSGWAWYPGPLGGRHYWRPALVGFFGWGGGVGVGVGFGFGNVGWVPLAPYERYRPWYGRGGVSIVANVNVTGVYRNARFERGITSVRAGEFGRGVIRSDNYVRPQMNEIARGGLIRGSMPMSPARESFRMSDRAVNTQGMPRTNQSERFYSRASVAGGAQQNNGGWRRLDGPSTARPSAGLANRGPQGGTASNGSGGWKRLDGPAAQSSSQPRQYSLQRPQVAPSQQTGQRQYAPQQPVRISPPIVRDRGASGSGSDVHGFGGAHASGSGGGGNHGGGNNGHSSGKGR